MLENGQLIRRSIVHVSRSDRLDEPNFIATDTETGAILVERWEKGRGIMHRSGKPALIERDSESRVTREAWYVGGELHRDDGPASTDFDPETGQPTLLVWYRHAKLHRKDGPAVFEIHPSTGVVATEEFRINGKLHRANAPALIRRDAQSGRITSEEYHVNGRYHRVGAPAVIQWRANAKIATRECWYLYGSLYRADGPALTSRDDSGEIIREVFGSKEIPKNPNFISEFLDRERFLRRIRHVDLTRKP